MLQLDKYVIVFCGCKEFVQWSSKGHIITVLSSSFQNSDLFFTTETFCGVPNFVCFFAFLDPLNNVFAHLYVMFFILVGLNMCSFLVLDYNWRCLLGSSGWFQVKRFWSVQNQVLCPHWFLQGRWISGRWVSFEHL